MRYGTRLAQTMLAVLLVAGFGIASAPAARAAEVDPDDWATDFCGAFEDFGGVATTARETVDEIIDNGVDASKVKGARNLLKSLLKDASDAADEAAAAIETAGTPDVPNGSKISATMVAALDRAALVFSLAAKDTSGFSTDAKKFKSAVKKLKSDVDNELEKIGNSVTKIGTLDKGGLIDAAISKAPACQFLL